MNADQFGYVPTAVPQPPGTGRVLLSNGREMIGTWGWNKNLMVGHFTDTGGVQWVIDVREIVAFSPITETPGTADQPVAQPSSA